MFAYHHISGADHIKITGGMGGERQSRATQGYGWDQQGITHGVLLGSEVMLHWHLFFAHVCKLVENKK
jgi:hypothetical protein